MAALFERFHSGSRVRADAGADRRPDHGYFVPESWLSSLSHAGIQVTPDLAMTLSAFASGIRMKGYDLGTCPNQVFKYLDEGGKERVRTGVNLLGTGGIGNVAYMLRWQPNAIQTATEYMVGQVAQFHLRGKGYAEIAGGRDGAFEQLLPRHPDRVFPERLPFGRLRYKLIEFDGRPRYLNQDEMHVIRDLSLDGGFTSLSRVQYGANSFGNSLATQKAVGRFFKTGMAATMLATYKGDQKAEGDEDALHKSIARYAAGTDNYAGLMLVPDYIDIKNLSIEPEKAQMMLAQEWGVREAARSLDMPAYKLGLTGGVNYSLATQAAVDYVITCLRPLAVLIEQSQQRDLILAKSTYVTEILLEALFRGDPMAQAEYFERLVKIRAMRPSEVRERLNLNPDPALDRLSEGDFRPGSTGTADRGQNARAGHAGISARAVMKATLAVHDNAVRCLRRERAAVEKLALKHSNDPQAWQAGLRTFYSDHAQHVAQTMRISIEVARGVAAQHGSEFEAKGMTILDGKAGEAWERFEADELAALALADGNPQVIDGWFERPALPATDAVITQ